MVMAVITKPQIFEALINHLTIDFRFINHPIIDVLGRCRCRCCQQAASHCLCWRLSILLVPFT
jgi:hypothetical protein